MQTFELLIVFAALMAVIALAAIAIDWVGRPLRNRRFIPRIYRYGDEFVPDDHRLRAAPTPIGNQRAVEAPYAPMGPGAPVTGPPPAVTHPPVVATVSAELAPKPPAADAVSTSHPDSVAPGASTTRSTFSDNLENSPGPSDGGAPATGSVSGARPRGIAETIPIAAADSWDPTMALDARVGERKATVEVKAERFWVATAAGLNVSHFDDADAQRMAEGKAPRRRNPRTGDLESMELVGLRSASDHSDVRMRWPDDTVDPWSQA